MSPRQMTEKERAIYERGFNAGFAAGRRGKAGAWSTREVKTLVRWTGTDAALAEKIGRSPLAIRLKRYKMRAEGQSFQKPNRSEAAILSSMEKPLKKPLRKRK